MIRQAFYKEALRTDEHELTFIYSEGPEAQPEIRVRILDRNNGSEVAVDVEPDVLRSALESLFGGIYSGEA